MYVQSEDISLSWTLTKLDCVLSLAIERSNDSEFCPSGPFVSL